MSRLILFLRSLVFMLLVVAATLIWAPLCILFAPLPYNQRYHLTSFWNRVSAIMIPILNRRSKRRLSETLVLVVKCSNYCHDVIVPIYAFV